MSLLEKVEFLRRFFGTAFVGREVNVMSDVAAMNVAMGIDGEGSGAKEDETLLGTQDWWIGTSSKRLEQIFNESKFMGEAHIHGFANKLKREIIVVDERGLPDLAVMHYKPGYETQMRISMTKAEAISALQSHWENPPLWIMMSRNHFSALLPL